MGGSLAKIVYFSPDNEAGAAGDDANRSPYTSSGLLGGGRLHFRKVRGFCTGLDAHLGMSAERRFFGRHASKVNRWHRLFVRAAPYLSDVRTAKHGPFRLGTPDLSHAL